VLKGDALSLLERPVIQLHICACASGFACAFSFQGEGERERAL